jgi:hypothetical protein
MQHVQWYQSRECLTPKIQHAHPDVKARESPPQRINSALLFDPSYKNAQFFLISQRKSCTTSKVNMPLPIKRRP